MQNVFEKPLIRPTSQRVVERKFDQLLYSLLIPYRHCFQKQLDIYAEDFFAEEESCNKKSAKFRFLMLLKIKSSTDSNTDQAIIVA